MLFQCRRHGNPLTTALRGRRPTCSLHLRGGTMGGVTRIQKIGLVAIGLLMFFPPSAISQAKSSACQAATEKADYGNWLRIPEKTKTLIDSYRAAWKRICDPQEKGKPPLSQLFSIAKEIEADFKNIFEAFNDSLLNDANVDPRRIDDLENLVSRQFPRFVPAFHGAFGDHEYFSPSADEFRENAILGNTEDRLFFESNIPMEGDFPPFIRKTWDYGGCAQFGEFDWTRALKAISRVKKQVQSPAYLKETSQFENSIFRELTRTGDNICTCKAKESVLNDFLNVADYVKSEPEYSSQAPAVQTTIDGIKTGRIKVNSELEKHCSGG